MTTDPLDRAAVAAVDVSGEAADIVDLGTHLRDALWRVQSARLKPLRAPAGLVLAGMGGSAIGADLALAALGDRLRAPIFSARAYTLPAWTTAETPVLCASYSGNTEETLACYAAAGELGAPRIVATSGGTLAQRARADGVPVIPLPGGFQPRAAVGYAAVVALEVAALFGVAPALHDELEAAAALVGELGGEWGPDGPAGGEAKALAGSLHGSVPVITGAGLTAPVAYRWKCQFNENAKLPAFAGALPEVDHNEIVGWGGAAEHGRFAAVFLDDPDTDPRIRRRFALTAELIEEPAEVVVTLSGRGQSRTERVMSLVLLGDLASLYVAVLRGIDPTPVEVIEDLKARLARA